MVIGDDCYKIINCISCWYDLLGFGRPFEQAEWNLSDSRCYINIERLKSIKGEFSLSMDFYGTKLYVNDGIASTIDTDVKKIEDVNKVLYYLDSLLLHFSRINNVEKHNGFPGMRGVITAGHRLFYEVTNIDEYINGGGIISYHPVEFQMNTAYSKAYIIEESGSADGIKGPFLYVDEIIYSVIQKMFNGLDGYSIEINDDEQQKTKVTINANHEWFLRLVFEKEAIKYDKKGIHTRLYRLDSYESYLDWYAKNYPPRMGRFIPDED